MSGRCDQPVAEIVPHTQPSSISGSQISPHWLKRFGSLAASTTQHPTPIVAGDGSSHMQGSRTTSARGLTSTDSHSCPEAACEPQDFLRSR